VGEYNGSQAREVLMTLEQWAAACGDTPPPEDAPPRKLKIQPHAEKVSDDDDEALDDDATDDDFDEGDETEDDVAEEDEYEEYEEDAGADDESAEGDWDEDEDASDEQ
jgi:hypothetical protein